MAEDKPFNLFSAAAHQKAKKPTPSPASKKPLKTPPSPSNKGDVKGDVSDPEIVQMIEKMKKIHDEIEVKLEETYQKAGLNSRSIKAFLDNPNNFKPKEWERVQSERKSLLSQIWTNLGKAIHSQDIQAPKGIEKAEKERKGKLLGARRNWISMR